MLEADFWDGIFLNSNSSGATIKWWDETDAMTDSVSCASAAPTRCSSPTPMTSGPSAPFQQHDRHASPSSSASGSPTGSPSRSRTNSGSDASPEKLGAWAAAFMATPSVKRTITTSSGAAAKSKKSLRGPKTEGSKLERNKMSASRYRQRKKQNFTTLENKLAELETIIDEQKHMIASLHTSNTKLREERNHYKNISHNSSRGSSAFSTPSASTEASPSSSPSLSARQFSGDRDLSPISLTRGSVFLFALFAVLLLAAPFSSSFFQPAATHGQPVRIGRGLLSVLDIPADLHQVGFTAGNATYAAPSDSCGALMDCFRLLPWRDWGVLSALQTTFGGPSPASSQPLSQLSFTQSAGGLLTA